MPDPNTALPADSIALPEILPAEAVAAVPATVERSAAPAALPGKYDAVVDAWFNDKIHGSAIAQITPAYNAIYAALDDLKALLNKET
jgi:hypothetical protein